MDIIKITLAIFLVSAERVESKIGADCPSNTVEIVFTKNGIICATTSSVPELNHLSVDPKIIPELIGEPPIVHKIGLPLVSHTISNGPPSNHLIVNQMPFAHMSQGMPHLAQPPHQTMLIQPSVTEYMARRLPLYHENAINQNMDYLGRRPDLMEDKRLFYQKMLWDKFRRDAIIKKLIRNNQFFGIQYDNHYNNQINEFPQKTVTEEQLLNSPQFLSEPQNPYQSQTNVENTDSVEKTSSEEVSQVSPNYENDPNIDNNDKNTDNNNNENPIQEPIGSTENIDQNPNQELLKNYLKYLQNSDKPSDETKVELIRNGRHYNMGSVSPDSRVPDIIRGFMPSAPKLINGHTLGLKYHKSRSPNEEQQIASQSQLSYELESPDKRQYNHKSMKAFGFPHTSAEDNNKNMRLVGSEMTFGLRFNPKNRELKAFEYKTYPQINDENQRNAKQKQRLYEFKTRFTAQQLTENSSPYEEDVVLVTADPQQRQIIERIEAEQQKSRRNDKQIDDWTGVQSFIENNSIDYQLNRDFRLDESRIEYNGWKPIRSSNKSSDEQREQQQEEDLKTTSAAVVTSILPITGRINNKWKGI